MALTITQVDAFTSKPFSGNPAGVCLLTEPRDDAWMQNVAREMNLAETAFLLHRPDGYGLRWFTPVAEVDLCGHATLASAHVLWERGALGPEETARFHTKSGLLTAARRKDWIELDFPATPDEPVEAPAGLVEALGVVRPSPRRSRRRGKEEEGRGEREVGYVGKTPFDYLVEVSSEETVRGLVPDLRFLATLGTRGVVVTSRSSDPGVRLRLALLRAGFRNRRGPGHRLDPLRARALLGEAAEQDLVSRAAALRARRSPEARGRRRPRPDLRTGGHGPAG